MGLRAIPTTRRKQPADCPDRSANAAVDRRHVENIRLRRNTADRACASAAIRSNVSPPQNGIELYCAGLANACRNQESDYDCVSNRSHESPLSSANRKGAIL